MSQIVPLDLLNAGDRGVVVEVTGDTSLVTHLAEKGVRPGGRIEAIQPGDPFVLMVDGTRLTMRTDGRVEILVKIQS